ncbi:hypothetical protein IQ260_28200 [Leptolyngbya cf. ectocarpi LEGE 11479]|uniref:Uncharacterized protein n=1 Tax=Leptolyngbya cf. ectocarpi LEGE 11479 TaxID=1828722 RepID=A0A929A003_LEPEC|nr:hypothetical protein [Leptolyngbya ectocarpi]MBE9070531.1 hypothetical protein [Leptolyngbya cf. ectocarpi LEGE 11479]
MSINPILICSLAICQSELALSTSPASEFNASDSSTIEQFKTTANLSEVTVEPEISNDNNRLLVVPPENLAIPRFSTPKISNTELLEEAVVLGNDSEEASVHLETENEEVIFPAEFLSMDNNSIEDATQASADQLSREHSLQEPTEIRANDSESSLDGIRNIPREAHLLSELPQEEILDDDLGEVILLRGCMKRVPRGKKAHTV